jgi:hypothetical protein
MKANVVLKIIEPIVLLVLAVPVAAVAWAWGPLRYPVGSLIWAFLSGWVYVPARALPQVEVSLAGVATAVVCTAAAVGLLHFLAGWMYTEVRTKKERTDWPPAWRWRWTVSLIAAVMLIFVAGLVGVGLFRTTSWLVETPHFFVRENSIR